jgi:hypothetical protein
MTIRHPCEYSRYDDALRANLSYAVARHKMIGSQFNQRRIRLYKAMIKPYRTARIEVATYRRISRAGYIARNNNALALLFNARIRHRHSR